jgi:hypothetical protein
MKNASNKTETSPIQRGKRDSRGGKGDQLESFDSGIGPPETAHHRKGHQGNPVVPHNGPDPGIPF